MVIPKNPVLLFEATSGNKIGLSWVGAAKGCKLLIILETIIVERRKIIKPMAELVLTLVAKV